MTSQARITANQQNARRSTGPRTPEGKERSRMNALKHGLRAEAILLPTEDAGAFNDMLAEWNDDWKPPTGTRRQLVELAVAAAWRLNRCIRIEADSLSDRASKALANWDRERDTAIEADVRLLTTDPCAAIQHLKWTREGVARLIGIWEDVHKALAEPGDWYDIHDHHERFLNLRSFTEDDGPNDILISSWRLLLGSRPDLAGGDTMEPFEPKMADQVRESMRRYAGTMIEVLSDVWADTPDDGPARVREAERAAYKFNAQDLTMQRYESRLDRAFRSNLTQLISLTKTGLDLVEAESEPESEPEEVAPIEPKAEPVAAAKTKRKASSKSVAPIEPNAEGSETPVPQVERDRGGRIWPVEGVPGVPIDVDRV